LVMALERRESSFTYISSDGFSSYTFEVAQDQSGNITVRNIRTPQGLLRDPYSTLPEFVVDDMCEAQNLVEDLVAQTSTVNGQLIFASETSKTVSFPTPLTSSTYRVVFSKNDPIEVWFTGATTSGFTVEVAATYTGTIGYDVFI